MNKKIIGIPSFNDNDLFIKYLIEHLTDYEVIEVLPDKIQIDMVEKYSSKFICSSLKNILASNIASLDNNAEILININTKCNANLFFEYQNEILKNLNYDYKLYILNKNHIKEIYKILKKLNPEIKIIKFLYYYILSKIIIKFICTFEIYIKKNIGFEIKKGSFERIKKSFVLNFYKSENIIILFKYYFKYRKKLKSVLIDKPKSCKKIYMLDNGYKYSNNYYIEKELSKLNMKIEYYKNSTYSSSYKKLKNKFTSKKIKKICKYPLGNDYKIIKDIIDSSKIETGNYKINKKNNNIVYIAEEVALNMSNFIEGKGLSLIIDPEIEEKVISCDETEIERCVINLLGNAVKFTPEGGEIRVYIKEVKGYIEITIEDNGIGISKEDQEFIFKRFSQVEGNGATKATSSGIGLTLVKHIVDLHGGYIRLESELNKGSKFTIGLPDISEDALCNN